MNIEGVINAIPTMDHTKRQVVRERAHLWLTDPAKAADARRVLAALDIVIEREAAALADHVRPRRMRPGFSRRSGASQ